MKKLASVVLSLVFLATWISANPVEAADLNGAASVGPGVGQVTQVFGHLQRDGLSYAEHCDGTFENAYGWWNSGQGDPYYGAFAERFDLGSGVEVSGIRIYLTQTGYYPGSGLTEDLFVWGRGVGEPGAVLGMVPGVEIGPVARWPEVSAQEYAISAQVGSTFYIGCQANWPWEDHVWWFNGVDLDGPVMGEPWTCILPSGDQYPNGWQDVDAVWGQNAHSMGIGVYYLTGVASAPADEPQGTLTTWGRVKKLYDR